MTHRSLPTEQKTPFRTRCRRTRLAVTFGPASRVILMAGLLLSPLPAMAQSTETPKLPEIDPARQAMAAILDKEFRTARLAIKLVSDPFQRDALLFRLYRQSGNNASMEEIISFVEKHPDWPLRSSLRQRAEGALLGRIADDRLITWLKKHPPTTRLGCRRLIDRLIKRGDGPAADDEIVRCWKNLALSSAGEDRFLQRYGSKLSHRAKAARVIDHLERRRHRSADRLLAALDLPNEMVDRLEVRIDLQRKPRRSTVRKVLLAITKLPKETRADPAFLLDLTRWNRRRRNMAAAIKSLNAVPGPVEASSRQWWQERNYAIRRFLNARRHAQAYQLAAAHKQAPGNQFANAESLAGWIALRKRRQAKQSLAHFKKIFDNARRRDVRAMAAYWQGRAWTAQKNTKSAATWYTAAAPVATSLYGQMSLIGLGAEKLTLPAKTVVPEAEQKNFDQQPAPRLARFFAAAGDTAESRRVLWWLYREGSKAGESAETAAEAKPAGLRLLMIARLAHSLKHNDIALRAARVALLYGGVDLALAYPAPALPKGLPVEAALVLAITRQESEFNVNARSSANAQGLMQIIPATAKLMARRAKLEWDPSRLTGDAEYNTRLGAAYLDYLLSRFDQSYLLAAAAYNAGPTRVVRWIKRYGHPGKRADPVDWIESIPFSETRNYVRRVLANVLVYRARLGGGQLSKSISLTWRRPPSKNACNVSGECEKE